MRRGWHYTSIENWRKIRKEGLVPYPIDKPALRQCVKCPVQAIWIWKHQLHGLNHVGSIIFQNSTKGTMEVAYLEVRYDYDSLLEPDGRSDSIIQLPHTGLIGNLQYHDGDAVGVLSTETIPPERITLIKTYKLQDAWHDAESKRKAV